MIADLKPNRQRTKGKFEWFQLSCNNCFHDVHQGNYFIGVDEKGQPINNDIRKVFGYDEFKEPECCPKCQHKEFMYSIGINDGIYDFDNLDQLGMDLPF